ncbi:syntaxin-binding 5-like protein [Labeo rohita]|uniref:Syntaxin-binding 5-like protein n=1 Tax=Labeo rohita TaxID=84645 RepID=A0A498NPI9_LABRO|nr:syntaxin-binding 5-like protein [Labeo rohita]
MKKFNIRKVLTAVSSSSSAAAASPQSGNRENDMIQETLQSEHFQLCKTVRHGFPYQPSSMAFDPVQKILAIGTQSGALRLITFCHLPFQSKWLYVGTERGNIHIVNVESFTLSGYVIMWNKAIELSSKTHPGPVVHISDNPMDEGKAIHSVAWHHEGKQFVCSHSDGTLTTWNVRAPAKPAQIITPHDFQEPYAVVVLLEKDLVVIDLAQIGYPIFENPYPLSIHESPVTCCEYFADCPAEVIPALYSVGSRQKRQGFSKKVLYKLKTAKVFEKPRGKEDKSSTEIVDEDPFAIQILSWCPESRVLCVAGVSAHVIVYRFSKQEVTTEVIQLLEVRMQCELNEVESPEGGGEQASAVSTPGTSSSPQTSLPQSHPSTSSNNSSDGLRDNVPCLKVRSSPLKQSPGYQVELLIQLVWVSGEPPQQITSLAVNSAYGLVAFGNGNGLAVVDYIQKTLLLNVSTAELYGSTDPHHRQPRSPRKTRQPSADTLHKKSCMSGLSNFYSESVKKLRSSYLSSGSPCNSDEDSKQKFFDKAKISRKINMIADQKDDARDNSFSRSRSSSVTSIDRESREIISSFYFCDSLSKKSETVAVPSLWVGTSLGSMLAIALTVPSTAEQRMQQPVGVSFCGQIVRLKGAILRMAQLEASGTLMPHVYESWYEPNAPEEEKERPRRRRPTSPPSSQENADCQYAVVCSEKQAKVVAMPSQNCIYEHNITETSFVLRADVVTMTTGLGIACFCANGHIMTLSLPSLRPLLDVNYLPLTDMRIARTFCFSNQGQALYLTSPTEIQRITYSQETCDNLQEMLGELFTPVETPEAPNRGFFKGLFGGGAQSLDREDLFGEVSAGKASRSLAQHIPGPGGMEGMKGAASGVVGELARARIALDERGQKLGELEERTAAMMASADSFSKHAHDVR